MIIQVGEYVKFYFDHGQRYPVIEKRAYTKEDALAAVAILQRLNVPVEGGAVFTLIDGAAEPTDTSWKTNRQDFDDYDEFLAASHQSALEYIDQYNDSPDQRYLFELSVPFCIREEG